MVNRQANVLLARSKHDRTLRPYVSHRLPVHDGRKGPDRPRRAADQKKIGGKRLRFTSLINTWGDLCRILESTAKFVSVFKR